jgi:hypothetical protein
VANRKAWVDIINEVWLRAMKTDCCKATQQKKKKKKWWGEDNGKYPRGKRQNYIDFG